MVTGTSRQARLLGALVMLGGCAAGDDGAQNRLNVPSNVAPTGTGGSPAMPPQPPSGGSPITPGSAPAVMPGTDSPTMGTSGGVAGSMPVEGGMGGTGGMGSTDSEIPVAGMGATPPPPVTPTAAMPCMTNASEVLVIGDSYINYINPLVPPLEAKATGDAQLPAGQHYRNLAVPGAMIAQIEGQWRSGKASSKFVVMDGGGNDVLLGAPQCLAAGSDTNKACTDVVDRAIEVANRMVMDMKASGVKGALYFFYPHIPAGGDDILDYAYPLAKEACEGASDASFKCVFVDTRDAFAGHADYIFLDGIHPSATGARALADLVWAAMKTQCIAQVSGCCM